MIGSLETIWSAHEATVWGEATQISRTESDPDSPNARKSRRAALRDHEKLLAAIEAGNEERAIALASAHMAATRSSTLASTSHTVVNANLMDTIDLSSGSR